MANFQPIYEKTLKKEGGFQKFANDSANYVNGKLIGTNRGISAQAYATFYGKTPTEADMKALTAEQAYTIYKRNYWDKINGDLIKNQSVAEMMFQFVIGSGLGQISNLKDIANSVNGKVIFVSNDKPFTAAEIELINQLNALNYWTALKAWRLKFYNTIVANDIAKWEKANGRKITEAEALKYTDKQFLKGWINRLNSYTFEPTTDEKKNYLKLILAVLILIMLIFRFLR